MCWPSVGAGRRILGALAVGVQVRDAEVRGRRQHLEAHGQGAAAVAVDVYDLAGEVKSIYQAGLHGVRVDFFGIDATGSDHCVLEGQMAGYLKAKIF